MECFCCQCKEPICTECIVKSHNGHTVQALSEAYEEIKDNLQSKKDEIENNLLPKYRELLNKENKKQTALSKRADDIELQIQAHTEKLLGSIKEISEKTVNHLRAEKSKGLREIEKSKNEIERKITKIQQTNAMITAKLEASPGMSYFTPINTNLLKEFHSPPNNPEYDFDEFRPGQFYQGIQKNFGTMPTLRIQNNWALTQAYPGFQRNPGFQGNPRFQGYPGFQEFPGYKEVSGYNAFGSNDRILNEFLANLPGKYTSILNHYSDWQLTRVQ